MANRAIIVSGDPEDRALLHLMRHRLGRYATPWYRRPRLVVETILADDESDLADPALARRRVARADHVVLLCGPVTARSAAAGELCRAALEQRPAHRLVLAVADGAISWSKAKRDFNWTSTTALPRALSNVFESQPAAIAIPRAELLGEDAPLHPRSFRWLPMLAAILSGTTAETLREDHELAVSADLRMMKRVAGLATAAAALASLALAVPAAWLWEGEIGSSAIASRASDGYSNAAIAVLEPAELRAELARVALQLKTAERERSEAEAQRRKLERERDDARTETGEALDRRKQHHAEVQRQRAALEELGKSCTALAQDRDAMHSHAATARARIEAMEREMVRQRGKLYELSAICTASAADRTAEPKVRASLAAEYALLADRLAAAGDKDAALESYRLALSLRRRALEHEGESAARLEDAAALEGKVASFLAQRGDHAGAASARERAKHDYRRLAALDPGNEKWRAELSRLD